MKDATILLLSVVGSPFLGRTINVFTRHGLPVSGVVLDEGKPAGPREDDIWAERTEGRLPPIPVSVSGAVNVPCYFVTSHNGSDCVELLEELKPDIVVSAATPRILKSPVMAAAGQGVIAVHPGLIPAYRGCSCVEWAIANDDEVGNSVFFISEGIDAGPVVLTEGLRFSIADRYVDVRVKVYETGLNLLARGAQRALAEELRPENMPLPADGQYHPVMDDETFEAVKAKLENAAFVFQS